MLLRVLWDVLQGFLTILTILTMRTMLDAVFKASQQRQGDSLAPRSTDQEAEELEGVEDTWDLGIDRNRKIERSRGKQKEMTRTQRYAEHEKAEYIYI